MISLVKEQRTKIQTSIKDQGRNVYVLCWVSLLWLKEVGKKGGDHRGGQQCMLSRT